MTQTQPGTTTEPDARVLLERTHARTVEQEAVLVRVTIRASDERAWLKMTWGLAVYAEHVQGDDARLHLYYRPAYALSGGMLYGLAYGWATEFVYPDTECGRDLARRRPGWVLDRPRQADR